MYIAQREFVDHYKVSIQSVKKNTLQILCYYSMLQEDIELHILKGLPNMEIPPFYGL